MANQLQFPSFFDEDTFGAESKNANEDSGVKHDSPPNASKGDSPQVSPPPLPEMVSDVSPSMPLTEGKEKKEQESVLQPPPIPSTPEEKIQPKAESLPEENKELAKPKEKQECVTQPSPITSKKAEDWTQPLVDSLPEEKKDLSQPEYDPEWREDHVPSLLDAHPEVSSILNEDALLKTIAGEMISSPRAKVKNRKKRKKKKRKEMLSFGEFVKNHEKRMKSNKPISSAFGLDEEYTSSSSEDYRYSKSNEPPRPDLFTDEDFAKMGPPQKIDNPEKFVDDLFKDMPGWDTQEYERRSTQIKDFRTCKANCLLCIICFVFGHLWYMDYTRETAPAPAVKDVRDIPAASSPERTIEPYLGGNAEKLGPVFNENSGLWIYEDITFTQLIPGVVEVLGLPLNELELELGKYNFFDQQFCKVRRAAVNGRRDMESFGVRAVLLDDDETISQLFLARLIEQVSMKLFPEYSWDEFQEIQRVEVLKLKKGDRVISGVENPATPWSSRYTMLHFLKGSKTILTFPFGNLKEGKISNDVAWPRKYNKTEAFKYKPKPIRSILIRNIVSKSSQLPTAHWELKAGVKSYVVRQSF